MTIPITCGQCDAHFVVRDELAGKRVKCPKCSGAIQVAGGAASAKAKPAIRSDAPRSVPAKPAVRKGSPAVRAVVPGAQPATPVAQQAIPAAQPAVPVAQPAQAAVSVSPTANAVPAGQAVPDFGASSATLAGMGVPGAPMVGGSSSGGVSRRRGPRKKQTGMPVWAWAVLALAGAGGIGGWLAVASQKPVAKPVAQQPVPAANASAIKAKPATVAADAAALENGAEVTGDETTAETSTTELEAVSDGPLNFLPGKATEATADANTTSIDVATAGDAAPTAEAGKAAAVADAPTETMSAERLRELATACEAFDWMPTSGEDYLQLAKLAHLMNWARSDTATADGEEAAEETFAKIQALDWSAERRAAFGKFAGESTAKKLDGIFLAGTVVNSLTDQDGKAGLLIAADSTEDYFFVYVGAANAFEPSGARWIVLGKLVDGKISAPGKGGAQVNSQLVEQFYKFKLEK